MFKKMPSSNRGRIAGKLSEVLCAFTQYLKARPVQYLDYVMTTVLQVVSNSSHHRRYVFADTDSVVHKTTENDEQNILDINSAQRKSGSQRKARNTWLYSWILFEGHIDKIIAELPAICLSPHMRMVEFTSKEDKIHNNKSITHSLFIIILWSFEAMWPLLLKLNAANATQKLGFRHWRVEWNLKCFDVKKSYESYQTVHAQTQYSRRRTNTTSEPIVNM